MDKDGRRAIGVRYIDKRTKQYSTVRSRVVVLAASTLPTCRILLNSASNTAPMGLANSSGMLGKYLADSLLAALPLHLPALVGLPPQNEDGISDAHVVAPWWLHGPQKRKAGANFSFGYKIDVHVDRARAPTPTSLRQVQMLAPGLYGGALKQHMRSHFGTTLRLRAIGGMSLNPQCKVVVVPTVKDAWGMPTIKIDWRSSDEDYRRMMHMYRSLSAIADRMGATVLSDPAETLRREGSITQPVGANHETGGCRMGQHPESSVLNPWCRTWDVPNLYVADGAAFVTHPEKNPTLTIMALALRASDNIIDRLQANDL